MTVGFYYHDRMESRRYGPFWVTIGRNLWKFIPGEWIAVPKTLRRISEFRHHLAKVRAVGREGSNVIVHLSSA